LPTSTAFLSLSTGTGGSVDWEPSSMTGFFALDSNSILFWTTWTNNRM